MFLNIMNFINSFNKEQAFVFNKKNHTFAKQIKTII